MRSCWLNSKTRMTKRLLFLGICLGLWLPLSASAVVSFDEVKSAYLPSDGWLLARDGQVLQQLRIDHQVRRLNWARLEDVSPVLLQALIYSEDKRFYEHSGVDWKAAASASWRNMWNNRTRGASTLTMQLAGLLQGNGVAGHRSLLQKAGQTTNALRLDSAWRKDEILEAYLNLVTFRGELQGVSAMSYGLFNKAPSALDVRESALAAALLRAPNATPERVAERACALLKQLDAGDQCNDIEGFASLKLRGPFVISTANFAPHLARELVNRPGQQVRSTLDADLQRYASEQLRANLMQLAQRNVEDGSVLVLDNRTGQVLAWVGSSGALSESPEVDSVLAQRQAGSTLKPFLYAIAIQQHALTAASILDDSPVRIATQGGLYVPQNYDKQFAGPVSMRVALASSLNVPAVRTLLRLGPDVFQQRLQTLGFSTVTESGDYYGYSLALGAADVRLLDLTNAYRALANGGVWSDVVKVLTKTPQLPKRQAYSPQSAHIIADVLADRSARHYTFGLDSLLATRYWTAVKTGTSKDMRDNWCIGFSRRYTVGVWVGNAGGEPMHDVSGVSGAAPVWLAVMDYLHRSADGLKLRSDAPSLPKGVEVRNIRFDPAMEPPRRELFLTGTAQDVIVANQETLNRLNIARPSDQQAGQKATVSASLARIAYPGEGTIIALDPEIPPLQQRVVFKPSGAVGRGWQWELDGRRQASANKFVAWFPLPGRHTLTLQDERGVAVDTAHFEVRGAVLKTAIR